MGGLKYYLHWRITKVPTLEDAKGGYKTFLPQRVALDTKSVRKET